MKQGTHIQFQLVAKYYDGIKKKKKTLSITSCFCFFLRNMLVSTIKQHSLNSIYYKKRGTEMIRWSKGSISFSNPENKPTATKNRNKFIKKDPPVYIQALKTEHAGQKNRGWTSRVWQPPPPLRDLDPAYGHSAPPPTSARPPGVSDLIGAARWIPFSALASARRSGCCWLSWGAGSLLRRRTARSSPPCTLA